MRMPQQPDEARPLVHVCDEDSTELLDQLTELWTRWNHCTAWAWRRYVLSQSAIIQHITSGCQLVASTWLFGRRPSAKSISKLTRKADKQLALFGA